MNEKLIENINKKAKAYDVGVDANMYYPVSLEEILKHWDGDRTI